MSDYHIPVMLEECVERLITNDSGVYVDLTHGGGGHSEAILKRLDSNGRLYAFDQDLDASKQASHSQKLTFCLSNFRFFDQWLDYYKVDKVHGIFADLGISSWQIDEVEKGFAWRFEEGVLDMRMNQSMEMTASQIVHSYDFERLWKVFGEFGEVRNSKTLAKRIVEERNKWPTKVGVRQFNALLSKLVIGDVNRYFAQVYQALRIEVNDEVGALKEALLKCAERLEVGGRLVVLTYHSLEDKIVKHYIRNGNHEGLISEDEYGRKIDVYKVVGRKFDVPSEEEKLNNPRSRSAKLRVAEKL